MKLYIHHKRQIISIFFSIFFTITYSSAHITTKKYEKVIYIYSSYQTIDMLNNIIIFKEKVTLKYKNINLYANEICIQLVRNKHQILSIKAYGNPIITIHQIKQSNETITATSSMMHYDSINNTIHLIGNAHVQQSQNSIKSDNITYTIVKKTIQAMRNDDTNNQITTLLKIH